MKQNKCLRICCLPGVVGNLDGGPCRVLMEYTHNIIPYAVHVMLNGLRRDHVRVPKRQRVLYLSLSVQINYVSENTKNNSSYHVLSRSKTNLRYMVRTYSVKHLMRLASSSRKWNMSNMSPNSTVNIWPLFLRCSSPKYTTRLITV